MANTIKNLDELLRPFLNKNLKVKDYTTKPLTAAGENYGSLMLKLEVQLQENDIIHMVAKMCPPNEWLKKMFNTSVTFKREVALYKTIVPALKAFQQEQGISETISCFPECFGARISLNPMSDVVNDDAALLLENLTLSGYEVVDRSKGFNLETAKVIIKSLAVFHAVPMALKLLKPDFFNKNILPHLGTVKAFDTLSEEIEKSILDSIIDTAKLDPACVPLLPKVEKALKLCLHNIKNRSPTREPWGTISHNDLWVNNTMIKFVGGNPINNKMVDFQLTDYGSPGNDIVFFLFSSLQTEVINLHYDNLVKLYHNTFIATLRDLKCDTTPFAYELLLEEIDMCAKTMQFFHVMVMLRPMFAPKGTVKELHELTEDDLITDETISNEYLKKVPEMIHHFAKRKWI